MAASESIVESRLHQRLSVPCLYTLLRLRRLGDDRYTHTGRIIDISLGGMRFGVNFALEPGNVVEVRGMLPGDNLVTFRAIGRVVRKLSDGTLAMKFDQFTTHRDARRLASYLSYRSGVEQRLAA